jgi:hypothetical protein
MNKSDWFFIIALIVTSAVLMVLMLGLIGCYKPIEFILTYF